ncbi:hypothetical protein AB1Y20_013864 [Prymnesium parvum]|uniref:Uncharacterized protein n=1 Tax=Prymnesium parvum TaxID=97485 RepID=A0AB34IE70_PRYPA|mmetsp:Transcript_38743/g.68079  ORF Transcript_38743/g.68079 Transcript_38743/m.68079 type:complete len:215 (-) Transcript_38743:245-889(-)
MLALPAAAAAFAPAGAVRAPIVAQPSVSMVTPIEDRSKSVYSASIPFLKKPAALDGSMAGDRGFDPLGFTATITDLGGDLNYVREAELMHGRQAMLATVGFLAPAVFGRLPGGVYDSVSLNPLEAQYQLPEIVLIQLAVSIAVAEGLRATKVYSDSPPGEHGFDPMGFIPKFCDTPQKMMLMKEKEIKHCRIAMIAVTGMFFQIAVTGHLAPFY